MKNIAYIFAFLAVGFTAQALGSSSAHAAQSPVGTMVSQPDGSVSMVLETIKRPYTSAGAFLSYSFNAWADVKPATAEDIALTTGDFISPRDGSILCSDRGTDKGTCYLVSDSKKAGFVSGEIFKQLGFSFAKSLNGDVSFLTTATNIGSGTEAHRVGTVIKKDNTYYLVGKSGLIAMPTVEILNSWGYKTTDAVPANASDLSMQYRFTAEARQSNELRPFEPTVPVGLSLSNEEKFSLPFANTAVPTMTEAWIYSAAERAIHGNTNHGGIDFAQPRGTAVYAAADGYAISSTQISPLARKFEGKTVGFGLGEFIQIWHPDQVVFTSYSHLSKVSSKIPYFKPTCENGKCDPEVVYQDGEFSVDEGKFVKRGELIGYVGDSGLSWGYAEKPREARPDPEANPSWDETHLHFEMYTRAAPNYGKARRYDPFGIYGRLAQYNSTSYSGTNSVWKLNEFGNVQYAK